MRAAADRRAEFVRVVRAGRRRVGHPHRRARVGRRAGGRAAWRRSSPTSSRTCRRGSRRSRSARGCRAPASGGRCGSRRTGSWPWGSSRGACEYNDCRAQLGLPPLPYVHTRAVAVADDGRDVPAARVPAGVAGRGQRVVGPMLWEPGGPRVAPPAGSTGRSCSWRPRRRRTRRTRCCDACLEGLADEPVRVIAISEPRAGARERGARPVDVLRRDDAAVRSRGHATAGTGRSRGRWRAACRCWSARRPATWPRTPRASTGRASACGSRRGSARPGACGWPSGGRCATRRCGSGRVSWPRWAREHPGPATAATQLERWAATVETATLPPCGGAGGVSRTWTVPLRPGWPLESV